MNTQFRRFGLASFAVMGFMLVASGAQAGFQWTAPTGQASTSPVSSIGTIAPNRPFEAAPRAAAAPVAPVMTESLPTSLNAVSAGAPIATRPDGPASAAPIYGQGMTDDPITWNPTHSARNARGVPAQFGNAGPRGPQNTTAAENMPLSPFASTTPAPLGGQVLGPNLSASAPAAAAPTPLTAAPAGNMAAMAPAYGAASYGGGSYEMAEGFGRDLPLVMAIRQIVPSQYGFVFDQGIDISYNVSWQGGQPWDIVLQNTLSPLSMQATIRGNVVTIGRSSAGMMHSSVPGMGGGMQMASYTPAAQVSTSMVQNSVTTPMAPAPLMMPASAAAAPQQITAPLPSLQERAVDDMSGGGGYYNASSAPSVADLNAAVTWTAPRNSTLRSILEDWSQRVGVELYWASEYDYPIQSAVSVNGTFEDAVQTLLKGLTDSKPRPMGRLHPNLPNGPAVLVIETRQTAM